MSEREPRRESRSVRKHTRLEKARKRRYYAPSGLEISEMQSRAKQRLEELDLKLLTYITPAKKTGADLDSAITSHDAQTSIKFGECVSQKINKDLPSHGVTALGGIALQFVERMWIESALKLIKRDELIPVLKIFLDSCDNTVQSYLEERSSVNHLTRLQEVKNRVINPITGQLTIK